MIQERRIEAIDSLLTIPTSLIEKYSLPTAQCVPIDDTADPIELAYSYACDSMLLGSLIKSCAKTGIFPIPQSPFEGLSFAWVAKSLGSLDLKSKCDGNLKGYVVGHACHGVREYVENEVGKLIMGVRGLDLRDFKKLG